MSVNEKLTAIVGDAEMSNVRLKISKQEAAELEMQAKQLVVDAKNAQMDAFEAAAASLIAALDSGEYTQHEIFRIYAELCGIDPISTDPTRKNVDALVSRFDALAPGQPVIGLVPEPHGEMLESGIVLSDPTNLRIMPPRISRRDDVWTTSFSPYAYFNVPVKTLGKGGKPTTRSIEMSGYTLRHGLIGREAIEQAAREATFQLDSDRSGCHSSVSPNTHQLMSLRENIQNLYTLGMDEVETEPLDTAIQSAVSYGKIQQRLRTNRPQHSTLTGQRRRY